MVEFSALFSGLSRAYGIYQVTEKVKDGQKQQGHALTVRQPLRPEQWTKHLDGTTGLGIIPINEENYCWFGAIDIDVYTLSHEECDKQVTALELPLCVCRSKSGGIHLFLFTSEPIPAKLMRDKLTDLAILLGYNPRKTEIFPKQIALVQGGSDIGNWINLPYFGGDKTTRYCVHDGRSLNLQEFLAFAETRRVSAKELEGYLTESTDFPDGPPCLQTIDRRGGFMQGERNNGLYNTAIYLRNRFQDDWKERAYDYNVRLMHPPLPTAEVVELCRSVEKSKASNFKCNDHPIKELCNREICLTRKFGVACGKDDQQAVLLIGTLEKVLMTTHEGKIADEAPMWRVEVAGVQFSLGTDDLLQQDRFRKLCVERINRLPSRMKPMDYEAMIRAKLASAVITQAPHEASAEGIFWDHFKEFCLSYGEANNCEDLRRGRPYFEKGRVYFRAEDLRKFLETRNFQLKNNHAMWQMLKDYGFDKKEFYLPGNLAVRCWSMPFVGPVEDFMPPAPRDQGQF
jgi:hypothetical protein